MCPFLLGPLFLTGEHSERKTSRQKKGDWEKRVRKAEETKMKTSRQRQKQNKTHREIQTSLNTQEMLKSQGWTLTVTFMYCLFHLRFHFQFRSVVFLSCTIVKLHTGLSQTDHKTQCHPRYPFIFTFPNKRSHQHNFYCPCLCPRDTDDCAQFPHLLCGQQIKNQSHGAHPARDGAFLKGHVPQLTGVRSM